MALLATARPLMAKTYPADPWRIAWLDTVQGGCLLRQRDFTGARKLLTQSVPIVGKRWPAETLYGHVAALLLKDAETAGAR